MSNSWLEHPNTSNLFKQSYIKDFLDISGDLYIRNHNINGVDSDISMNGTLTCNSLTLTEGTGAGINSDVQTALDGKQDLLTAGTGVDISNDTISTSGGGSSVSTISSSSTSVRTDRFIVQLNWNLSNIESQYSTGRWGDGAMISDDGNTILIGMPMLDDPIGTTGNRSAMVAYRKTNGTWSKLGTHVFAINEGSSIPYYGDINISADGQYILHGGDYDPNNSWRGFVAAYKLVGNSWVQHGNTILGSEAPEASSLGTYRSLGKGVKIINNGNTILASNHYDNWSAWPFKVTIWDLIGSTWTLRSKLSIRDNDNWNNTFPWSSWSVRTGSANNHFFGVYMGMTDITPDGNTIIIGVVHRSASGPPGKALVLDYTNGNWVKRSATTELEGVVVSDRYGHGVSITPDGNTVAVSASGYSSNLGCIYVYDYINGDWSQRGNVIPGPTGSYLFGYGLCSLSNDGKYIAGADWRDSANIKVSYWSGTSWNTVATANSGRKRFDFARDAIKIVTGLGFGGGSSYNNVRIYGVDIVTTNRTDVTGNLDVSGNLNLTVNRYITVSGTMVHSDIRLKTDISRLTNTLEKILKLKPELYDKKNTINQDDGLYIKESGFIAQEIWYNIPELRHLIVLPDGVTAENIQDMSLNRVKPEYVDIYDISTNGMIDYNTNQIIHTSEDGSVTFEDIVDPNDYSDKTPDYAAYGWSNKPASINYEGLIAYLVGAIQELKVKTEEQTTEINSLT